MDKKRISILMMIAGILGMGLLSCQFGDPPECAIIFSIDQIHNPPLDTRSIDYTITNVGSVPLQNCKVEFHVVLATGVEFDSWTDIGLDVEVNSSNSGTFYIPTKVIDTGYITTDTYIKGAGFTNPKDDNQTYYSVVER